MKIFMLTSALDVGGAETHIYTLAKKLTEMGQMVVVGSSGGRTEKRLSSAGVRTVYAVADARRPLLSLFHCIKLYFFIRREGFQVLHGHTRPACFVLNIISRFTGIPLVTTVHARFSVSPLYRRLSAWGSATVAVSEDLRGYVCGNYSVDPENTYVIENGVDADEFYEEKGEIKPFRVVFASRLDRDCSSAAFSLCRLVPRLLEEYPSVEIVICGGGECFEGLRSQVFRMDKCERERIVLLGWVRDMGEILRSAGLFVGVSRGAIEAMFCGIPTVLAGDEGFIGLIDGEETLALGAESNFCCRGQRKLSDEELLLHIRRGFDMSEGEREELVSFIKGRIRGVYDSGVMAEKTFNVYRELIKRSGTGQGKRVLLCGYYGYGNLGDNALLRGAIRRARESFDCGRISALTAYPWRDCVTFGIPCVCRMNFFSVIGALMRTDILVFGGGTLLQDRTSLRSFIYYAYIIKLAALLGCRIELWGNGLGDIRRRFSLYLLKRVLGHVDYIGLRDRQSVDLALLVTGGGDGTSIVFEGDIAQTLMPSVEARVNWLLRQFGLKREEATARYAVIAVKGSGDRESISELERYMVGLWEKGAEFLYIPMFRSEDEAESLRLQRIFGGSVARFISESDALGLISKSGLVCSMRFHALVFASMSGVPFVAFGRDPKVREFMRG